MKKINVAGSDGNHVVLQSGNGSCSGGTVLTYTLNGNAVSLPSKVITNGCGKTSTLKVTGNLKEGTLTMNTQGIVTATAHGASSTGGDTTMPMSVTYVMTLNKK